jgi:hypothetical protein
MADAFNDKKNRLLYFDRTDTAQVVVDGAIGLQVYSMLASRDTSPAAKMAIAGGGLLAGNYLYNTVLRDAVQAVLHPGDAMIDAAHGHGTVPGDVMLGGAVYGAHKGGSKAYAAYQARGATQVAEAVPEVEGSAGVLETLEGVGEGVVELLPEATELVELAPLVFL